jgi:hypothetical protein
MPPEVVNVGKNVRRNTRQFSMAQIAHIVNAQRMWLQGNHVNFSLLQVRQSLDAQGIQPRTQSDFEHPNLADPIPTPILFIPPSLQPHGAKHVSRF